MPLKCNAAALSLVLATFAVPASAQDAKPLVDQRDFAVQADPKHAAKLNPLLAQVAEPVEFALQPGEAPQAMFDRLCGTPAPPAFDVRTTDARAVVVAPPCLRSTARVTLEALPNSRLEPMAVSLGFARSSARQLSIIASDSGEAVSEGEMRSGDTVVAERSPEWTDFTVKPGIAADRKALLAKVAQSFPCDGQDAELCLFKLGIMVAGRTPPRPLVLPQGPPPPTPVAPLSRAEPPRKRSGLIQRVSMQEAAPAPTPAKPPPPKYPPVADAEWPYDRAKLVEIFQDIEAQRGRLRPVTVGVADIGLGSWQGAPLPVTMMSLNETDDPALPPPVAGLPNQQDDDEDSWIDDWYGAGTKRDNVFRSTAALKTGDLALCPAPVDYSTWSKKALRDASHGAITASLAGGRGLDGDPQTAFGRAFPQVLFYRLAGELCRSDQSVAVGDVEMLNAFGYLLPRANILSISYIGDTSELTNFTFRIRDVLWQQQKLLFMPAGNQPGRNFDLPDAPCPQCLVSTDGHKMKARLLLVGAATQDRKRAGYSGFGPSTVKLWAPGSAQGALDITGQAADPNDAATSYATPYAAFAAALLESIGKEIGGPSASAIRGRLRLSTWLLADETHPDAGVIDLVKVAAALHNVVEVREFIGGKWVVRNYVGKVTGGLENICAKPLSPMAYQAVRLYQTDDDEVRRVFRFKRDINEGDSELAYNWADCRPTGVVTLKLMDGTTKDLPLKDVSQILLSWSPNWSLPVK